MAIWIPQRVVWPLFAPQRPRVRHTSALSPGLAGGAEMLQQAVFARAEGKTPPTV